MHPMALIPAADTIPVASWWFEVLGILTIAVHFMMVNMLLGGGLVSAYLGVFKRETATAKAISNKLPTLFALTVNFGVAPLLFLQVVYGQFFYTSAVLSAVWLMGTILLLILGYYSLYIHQHRQTGEQEKSPIFLFLSLVMILLISLVLTTALATMEHPELWDAYFTNAAGTLVNYFEPTTAPRYLHFLMASIAVGGLFVALATDLGWIKTNTDETKTLGLKVFTTATMLQMAAGLWWLMALERDVMLQFMGDNAGATGLFVFALLLAFLALSSGFKGQVKRTAVLTGLTILAMSGVRAMLRMLTLAPFFTADSLPVRDEYAPLVMFLAALAAGLLAIAYMLKLAFKPGLGR